VARKHRPYGKNEASEERGRDKGVHAKARKHRIRHNIKKALREADVDSNSRIHYEWLKSFRL
jgi:hypothetical protein